MKKSVLFYSLFILIFTIGCDNSTPAAETTNTVEESADTDAFNAHINAQKMQEIEERVDPTRSMKSLVWKKEKGGQQTELIQVIAYGDEVGGIFKVSELFMGGNYEPQGTRNYYLENNVIIGISEELDIWEDSLTSNWVEKRTIYDEEGPFLSQFRKAPSVDEIEESPWVSIAPEEYTLDKVNAILSKSGAFQTHFISVIKGDNLFLLLGEAKEHIDDRYTTAVRVDEMTPFIADLLDNRDAYKFRPVHIEYISVGGMGEPEFNVLTEISWLDEE